LLHFGIFLDFDAGRPIGVQVDEFGGLCELAAEAGFESAWTGENHPRGPDFLLPSPMLVLAALARRVELELGTGVILLPLWNPLKLAYESAVLDQLCGGRFILGLGVGAPHLWERYGVRAGDVAPATDETLACLQALWRGEASFEGRTVSASGPLWPLPARAGGIPIWVAGRIGRSAARAAEHGQAWYASTPVRIDELERFGRRYRAELERRGKDPSAGRVACNRWLVVVEHEDELATVAKPHVSRILEFYAGLGALRTRDGVARRPEEALFELFAADVHIAGTPDVVAAAIRRYADAGVTDLNFRVLPGSLPLRYAERTLRLFRGEVLPRLEGLPLSRPRPAP
jgi:alkanesulfonate monooxygenase SsuD/methylene tetrahydromethanopterin reductase-like flavin-dependent oxidoreductase (luciferase family)